MVIRDDRRVALESIPGCPLVLPRHVDRNLSPDRVLYSCPDCGRAHFVTVDACPDPATAAAEVALVDGRKAA